MLLGVDVGGTFTDAVLIVEQPAPAVSAVQAGDPGASGETGAIYTAKVPSTPADQARAVLEAVRWCSPARARPGQVERFAHGMTVATNALLEGRAPARR